MADDQQRTANVVLTADTDAYRQSIQAAAGDTNKLTGALDSLTQSLDRVAKYSGRKMMLFGAGSTASVVAATVAFAAFDKQMTALKVNAEVTGRSYGKMERNVNSLRRDFGMTTATAAQLNKTLLGYKDGTASVESLSKTFAKLGAVTGESTTDLTQRMLQLQRSMGTTQKDTAKYANVLTDLSVKNGVAASSILDFSQAIAPIGRVAGMSQTAIMGVSTAFNKAGQDGFAAAGAFNKMLSDIMTATQSGSPDLAKYSNLIGVTVDQFKSMDKTTAITDIFDELNRLGPNAIQILNRMGLDGMRMQRAIQGVSQSSGGIGTAVTEAMAAYNNDSGNALNGGSAVALDSVSEKMAKLTETTKQFGETVGAAFEGPAKIMLSVLEKAAAAITDLAGSPLGQLSAKIVGLIGPMGILVGLMLKFAGGMSALATGRVLTSNHFTGGFKDAQNAQRDMAAGMPIGTTPLSPFGRSVQDGNSNAIGRAMHRLGQVPGALLPPLEPGYRSRALGTVPFAGRQLFNFMSMAYNPLTPANILDGSKRMRFFASPNEAAATPGGRLFSSGLNAYSQFGQQIREPFHRLTSRDDILGRGLNAVGRGYNAAAGFIPGLLSGGPGARPPGPLAGFTANLSAQTGAMTGFVGSLTKASAGLGVLAAKTAGPLALQGVRAGIGGLAGMAMANPMMLAMYGGMAAYGAHKSLNAAADNNVGPGTDNISLMDSYRVAVGAATTATQDFATALNNASKQNAPETKRQALMITQEDKDAAAASEKLTNAKIAGLTKPQAANLLRGAITAHESPETIQAMKLDFMKNFGARGAAEILDSAQGKGTFSMPKFLNQLADSAGHSPKEWFGLKTNKKVSQQYELLEGQLKKAESDALATGGSQSAGETQKVFINQFMTSMGRLDKAHRLSDGERSKSENFLNKALFGGGLDIGGEGTGASRLGNRLNPFNQYDINSDLVQKAFEKSPRKGLQNFYKQMLSADKDSTTYDAATKYLDTIGETRKSAAAQVKSGQGPLFNTDMGYAKFLSKGTETSAEKFQRMIQETDAGSAFRGNKVIAGAIAAPGNQNKQIQAVDEMVRVLRKQGASYAQVEGDLIAFQAAIQDTTDPLYQLADAARGVNAQQASYKVAYEGQADKFQYTASNYEESMKELTPQPGKQLPPDAAEQRKKLTDSFEQYKQGIQAQVEQQIIAQREYDKSVQRSNHDFFKVQLPRMAESYNLSRERSEESYNISRYRSQKQFNLSQTRSEQEFGISRSRSYDDFHLSQDRAQQQFDLSRNRAEQSYSLSRKRSLVEFQISRARAEQSFAMSRRDANEDFNISRRRAAQDFHHEEELMVKQSAQTMMNIYDRVMVQRTWSAEGLLGNSEDQNRRLSQQKTDLTKARKLGVSSSVIQQMGFTDPNNAQQLSRFLEDIIANPALVQKFNKSVKKRLGAAGALVTDQDNSVFQEMTRAYRLASNRAQNDFERTMSRSRRNFRISMNQQRDDFGRAMRNQATDFGISMAQGAEDFKTTMTQGSADFKTSMNRAGRDFKRNADNAEDDFALMMDNMSEDFIRASTQAHDDYETNLKHMRTDYKTQQTRAAKDLKDFQTEITTGFVETLNNASDKLSGYLQTQVNKIINTYNGLQRALNLVNKSIKNSINENWKNSPGLTLHTTPGDRHHTNMDSGRGGGGSATTDTTARPSGGGGSHVAHSPVAGIRFGHANSAHFGEAGSHWSSRHTGEDYAAPSGTPIHAVLPGVVSGVEHGSWHGNMVKIRHAPGIETWYAHESRTRAKTGDHVAGGDTIGYVGATGNVTGPHVHLELRVNGVAKDPDNIAQYIRGVKLDGSAGIGAGSGNVLTDIRKNRYEELESIYENSILYGMFPTNPNFLSSRINAASNAEVLRAIRNSEQLAQALGTNPSSGAPGAPSDVSGNRQIVKNWAHPRGWDKGKEWDSLYALIMSESGFRNTAQNQSGSSAYGIFQFLDGTWSTVGGHKTSDANLQSKYGMRYIAQRYGDPNGAWTYHKAHNSYADGSIFTGSKTIGVGEAGPEAVLPLNQRGADFLAAVLNRFSPDAQRTRTAGYASPVHTTCYHSTRVDSSTNFTGPVSVQSQNPDEMAEKLRIRERRNRLTMGAPH